MKIRSLVEASNRMGDWLRERGRHKRSFSPKVSKQISSFRPRDGSFSSILGAKERILEKNVEGSIFIGSKVTKAEAITSRSDDRTNEIDRRILEEYEKLLSEEMEES